MRGHTGLGRAPSGRSFEPYPLVVRSSYAEITDVDLADAEERRERRSKRRSKRRKRRGKKGSSQSFKECMTEGIEERIEKRMKRLKGGAVAASALSATGSAVAALAPPWSLVGAGVLWAVAGGLGVAGAIRRRGNLALAGDQKAIAGYLRRAARWSSKKRARKLVKHKKALDKVLRRKKRQCQGRRARRGKGPRSRTMVRESKLKLKLGALVALEIEAKRNSKQPLVAGDDSTIPEFTDVDPAANADSPLDDVDPPEFSVLNMGSTVAGIPAPVVFAGGIVVTGLLFAVALRGSRSR